MVQEAMIEGFWNRVTQSFRTSEVQQIAMKLGLKYQSVRKWKLGELPSLENLVRISRVTGSSIDWLLKGTAASKSEEDGVSLSAGVAALLRKYANGDGDLTSLAERLIKEAINRREYDEDRVVSAMERLKKNATRRSRVGDRSKGQRHAPGEFHEAPAPGAPEYEEGRRERDADREQPKKKRAR